MSQGTYTINAVSERTVDDGDYRIYYVRLNEAQPKEGVQAFELVQKKTSNAPKAGQTIDVKTFQEGTRDGSPSVKIIKDWDAIKARQASGGTSSTGGGKSPDQQRSIVRQHSQEMALRFIAATGDLQDMNLSDPALVGAYLSGTVRRLTDWFANDASAAAPAQQTLNGGGGEVPADMRDMAPAATASTTADEDIPF